MRRTSRRTGPGRATDEAVARLGPLTGLVVSAGVFEGAYLRT